MTTSNSNSEAPWNFSWILPNELAAMAWPQTSSNILFLYEQGIRHLVTLSPEKRPPIRDKLFQEHICWTEVAIEEFEAPTIEQIREFIAVCEDAKKLQEVGSLFYIKCFELHHAIFCLNQ